MHYQIFFEQKYQAFLVAIYVQRSWIIEKDAMESALSAFNNAFLIQYRVDSTLTVNHYVVMSPSFLAKHVGNQTIWSCNGLPSELEKPLLIGIGAPLQRSYSNRASYLYFVQSINPTLWSKGSSISFHFFLIQRCFLNWVFRKLFNDGPQFLVSDSTNLLKLSDSSYDCF